MPADILGFAYAATVAAGGIVGYAKAGKSTCQPAGKVVQFIDLAFSGSVPSLAAGLTFGALLGYGAFLSSNEPPRPLLQIGTALVLAGMMGSRWARSGKFMPPGLICVLSCAMLARGLIYHNRYLPMIGAKNE